MVAPVAQFDTWSDALSHPWDGKEPAGGTHNVGGVMIDHPWQLVERNGAAIVEDFPGLAQRPAMGGLHGVTVFGSVEQLFVDPAARVEPHVILDATKGPIVIERGASCKRSAVWKGRVPSAPGRRY